MSQSAASIVAYLELLHANRHLVAAAYSNGGVASDADNLRKIRQLQQSRVLVHYVQDDFRLSPSLSRHFDEVFQRQRSYAVGANFSELLHRLEQLLGEYISANHEGRLEDQEDYQAEYDVAVFELAALVGDELLNLRVITENQFANVSTLAEKRRQNEFYLNRAEKIGETLALLEGESLLGQLQGSSLLKPLLEVYRHQVLNRLPQWRATHMDITAVLKAYLYRLRQVEPNARRIRAFAHFLRKTPDYQPPVAQSLHVLPAWSSRFSGLRLKTHADLASSDTRDALADLAKGIASAKVSIFKQRLPGQLVEGGTDKPVRFIQAKPVQVAFHRYMLQASAAVEPLSAINWKRQQHEFDGLANDSWLLYALHAVDMLSKSRSQHIQLERRLAPDVHARTGNLVVTDLAVWKKP